MRDKNATEITNGFWKASEPDNNFVDLIRRWLETRNGTKPDDVVLEALMRRLFDAMAEASVPNGPLEAVFEVKPAATGRALAVNWRKLLVRKARTLFRCDKCGSFTGVDLTGVCPQPRCRGKTRSVPAVELPANDPQGHSDTLIYTQRTAATELRSEEHTAQLASEAGQEVQDAFQTGQVNVISCSTTFEMGIDLGDLQAVVLRTCLRELPTICNEPAEPGAGRTVLRSFLLSASANRMIAITSKIL